MSVLVVALVVIGVCIGVPIAINKANDTENGVTQTAVEKVCQATSHAATCNQTLTGEITQRTRKG